MEPFKDPFEVVLEDGASTSLAPQPGYRLKLTYVALQNGDEAWVMVDGKPLALVRTEGHGVVLSIVLEKSATISVRGGKVVVFMYWELYNSSALYADYESSDSEDLPTIGDKKFHWNGIPDFQGKLQSEPEPPLLVAAEDAVEPPARAVGMDVTPPRMFALVPSSSPERSASRSEDEGGYFVKIPSQSSPTLPTVPRKVFAVVQETSVKKEAPVVSSSVPPSPSPVVLAAAPVLPKETEMVFPTPQHGRAVPKGVLKRRSRLLRVSKSPRMSPKSSPTSTPKKRKVIFNPRSPDIRFISPPLSSIHKAFSGGLLDLGVPLLTDLKHAIPDQPVQQENISSPNQTSGRKPIHIPHLQPVVTPKALRPTVIE
eukprot:TRINITY_DN3161_c2_g1_i1.p1 TRINITY_DN3161_c2_g1~~TRINITY_DN3161_c2_g1_i1.p1  ORF type:complete len:396 (+),score=90.06 TRINITY_DN3161_c2_g1_i1:79-1188(+)